MMRIAANIDEWVLIGVSYAAIYAQIIATQYPESVESMVLDSATFPNLKPHDNYLNKVMAGFLALYNYCNLTPDCSTSLQNIEDRIWSLHKALNINPIQLELDHPYKNNKIDVLLNGERFISALLDGTYGEKIFAELPSIIVELETRRVNTITPYLEDHIAFLLDLNFGDVSMISHYCYEDKPYTNFESIRMQADKLPEGHIRNTALLSIDFPDYCNEMLIGAGNPVVSLATKTDIPSLFLHGELDTITPLSDVIEQRKSFIKSRIVTYKLSHCVISGDECAELVAAKFINNTEIDRIKLDCS
jgi:pimeloyl-ACP methyl ester carboxylesterase